MPADPKRIDHALALAADGKPGEADTLLAHLARTESDPTAAWHLGWLRLRAGDAEGALAILREFGTDPICNERAREQLVGERRNAEAVAVIRMRPRSDEEPRSLVATAFEQHLARDYAGAAATCRRALAIAPAHAPAHNHLGRALHNQGNTAGGLAEFERAVHADPRYPEAWHNLAHSLRANGELERSCEALQRALAISPGYRSARLNLGINLYAMDQPGEALACFESLLKLNRDDVEAMVNAGACLQRLGQLAKGRQRLQRALELDPLHQWAHYYLGTLLSEQREYEAAKRSLQQALKLRGDDPDAWAELAIVYQALDDLPHAQQAVQTGLTLAPQHALLNVQAARLDRRRGDSLGAEARLRRLDARKITPRVRQRYEHELGRVLDRNARSDEAFRAFEASNQLAAANLSFRKPDAEALFHRVDEVQAWLKDGAPGLDGVDDGDGDTGADLCFQFGFPRSDHASLDAALRRHPALGLCVDQPTLAPVVGIIAGLPGGYPGAIARLDRTDRMALRRSYRLALSRLGVAAGTQVVDRAPLHTLHVGLVQALFPRARLLWSLRHPCDVVLANFMRAEAMGEAGINFHSLAGAVRSYDAVMGLWQRLQPRITLPLAQVRYESLAESPESALAEVFAFLGLEGAPEAPRADAPAHRGPRRAAARWLRYRDQLQPWMDTLGAHARRLGYTID
ncbi:tetratricopeptide repeat-containing sulfotransferase family protein [Arenimonas sp. MALMAid1274]|uniref:tetratricopeptide repeat-containing sulfotransferase family protein n=1 Tax=Arenimonas sp. MALMAid1274 TaxID=3411630 RepID=UPI003BA297F0